MAEAKGFSIEEALKFGWDTTKDNFVFFLILLLIVGAVNFIPGVLADAIRDDVPFVAMFFDFAGWVLGILVSLGLIKVVLKFADKKKAEFADLFMVYPMFFQYLFASIVYGLVTLVGFILLIIPGFIWLIKYSMFGYLMVDRKLGALEALAASGKATEGARLQLFWFGIVFAMINFFGALLFMVGLLVTIPVTSLAAAYVYRQLLSQTKL
ncbi:hypothetical protein GTO10_05975 [Candidatus Saccharibacteria bacterium]|nr:hypothetical protein [Candidatus Saccharibacteria bacterium]